MAKHYNKSVLIVLCVTYFLTSITKPDLQSIDMRHIPYNVSAPSGVSST